MKTDQELYTLLSADAELLRILTDGIEVSGPYHFEAIEVKGLTRRTDGVLLPDDPDARIWIIEFQAWLDPNIYYRVLIEIGLIGERHPDRQVYGMALFATPDEDPKTAPWHGYSENLEDPPIRVAYLSEILAKLADAEPDHPVVAVFLPYMTEDLDALRERTPEALERIQRAPWSETTRGRCLDVFWSWLTTRFKTTSYEELLRMFGHLPALEETQVYKDLIAKGREEAHRSEAEFLRRLVRRRFGSLPLDLEQGLDSLALTQLERLVEEMLDCDDPAWLEAWLERSQSQSSN